MFIHVSDFCFVHIAPDFPSLEKLITTTVVIRGIHPTTPSTTRMRTFHSFNNMTPERITQVNVVWFRHF